MKDLLQKVKVWYDKTRMAKISYKKYGMRPSHDWRVILVATFVLLCAVSIVAFYFYIQINEGKLFVVTQNKTEKEIELNVDLLKKTIDDLNLRENTLIKIKQNRVVPVEPSS